MHDNKEEHWGKSSRQIAVMKKLVDAGICCHETEDTQQQQRPLTLQNSLESF
jgi:hypothetical protein